MSLDSAGIFPSLQFLGVTIGVVFFGRLLDRLNARYLLAGGTLLMGSGLLLLGTAQALPVALIGTLLLGLGYGALDISPNVVIATLNPDRASAALNLLNVFYGVGAVVGPQVVKYAQSQNNFSLAFTLAAVFTLLLTIPLAFVSVQPQRAQNGQPRVRIQWITLLPFALLLFMYVGGEVGFSSWIATQLSIVAHAASETAANATSIFWAGLTLGRLAASLLLRRLTDEQLLLLSIILIGLGVGLLLLLPEVEGTSLISAFVVGFGCGPIFPTVLAVANKRYPEARGLASGVLIAIGTLGASTMPWLQGQIGARVNGGMILVLALAVGMFGMMLVIQWQTASAQTVTSAGSGK
jgi:fucose permease